MEVTLISLMCKNSSNGDKDEKVAGKLNAPVHIGKIVENNSGK